jgi:CelD/BcsL family acetyltransferase involved in cellulose biosynthesis
MLTGGVKLAAASEPVMFAPIKCGPVRVEERPVNALPADWRAAWDRLAADASEVNVFAERWFVEAGVRHLLPPGETRLLAVWRGTGTLLGLVPLRIERRYGRTPVAHVQNWLHHQSFLGTPLVRRGEEATFWTAVIEALDSAPWARGFLHVSGLVEDGPVHRGLAEAARLLGRPCPSVHRSERALLESGLAPQAYYEAAVRKKKRKEINRLSARLRELGKVSVARSGGERDLETFCDEFLALEASGWKGRAGSALASDPAKHAFFRHAIAEAAVAGRLELLRLAVNDRPIAMLVNFMAPPGGFTFKIAFDEEFARFSPGVLLQIENLKVLERADIAWMDSCASENHPMIDRLWMERRRIVRVTVPLSGWRRGAIYRAARALETGSAFVRRLIPSRKRSS